MCVELAEERESLRLGPSGTHLHEIPLGLQAGQGLWGQRERKRASETQVSGTGHGQNGRRGSDSIPTPPPPILLTESSTHQHYLTDLVSTSQVAGTLWVW